MLAKVALEGSGVAASLPPPHAKKISGLMLFLNMVVSLTGTVVLGIGAQMRGMGWILAPVLLILGAVSLSEAVWCVSATIDVMTERRGIEVRSYQDYAEGALGIWGRRVGNITSCFALFGILANVLVLISSNLQAAVPLMGGSEQGRKLWGIFVSPATAFFAFADMSHLLEGSGILGMAIAGIIMVTIWAGCFLQWRDLDTFTPACREGAAAPTLGPGASSGLMDVVQVCSYMIFIFTIITTLPTLKHTMAEPQRAVPMTVAAFVFVVFLLLSIMMGYYAAFGNLGPDLIVDGFRTNRPTGWWALNRPWETGTTDLTGKVLAWTFTFHLLIGDAIYVPCTLVAFEALYPSLLQETRAGRVSLRITMVVLRLLVANYVSGFLALTGLVSALFSVTNNLLFPIAALYAAGPKERVGVLRRCFHVCMFMFGCVMVVLGTTAAVRDLAAGSPPTPGTDLRTGISQTCREAFMEANDSSVASFQII